MNSLVKIISNMRSKELGAFFFGKQRRDLSSKSSLSLSPLFINSSQSFHVIKKKNKLKYMKCKSLNFTLASADSERETYFLYLTACPIPMCPARAIDAFSIYQWEEVWQANALVSIEERVRILTD